jgi:hypothetical protein
VSVCEVECCLGVDTVAAAHIAAPECLPEVSTGSDAIFPCTLLHRLLTWKTSSFGPSPSRWGAEENLRRPGHSQLRACQRLLLARVRKNGPLIVASAVS